MNLKRLPKFLAACLLLASFATPLAAKPDLDATSLKVNDRTPDPGDLITCSWTAVNRTGDYVGSTEQGVLLSTSSTVKRSGSGVTLLGREGLGPLGGWLKDSSPEIKTVKLPSNLTPGKTYYISVWADYDRERDEGSNEGNNGSNAVSITIRGPDLVVEDLTGGVDLAPVLAGGGSSSVRVSPGQELHLDWTARNRGEKGTGYSQQGIYWSTDANLDSEDTRLRRELLGPLPSGWKTEENATIFVPKNAKTGQTYYVLVKADADGDESETNEKNNVSKALTVRVVQPWTYMVDLTDFNYLPYLEDDDERLRDRTGDEKPDEGVTMNRSRCFSPGDTAYINYTVTPEDFDIIDSFNKAEFRLSAYHNTQISESGRTFIGRVEGSADGKGREFNLRWNVPTTPGDYYLHTVVEADFGDGWEVQEKKWLDGGSVQDPVRVTDALPIILVHGWSDTKGETFKNLEFLIECELRRPVRFFQYETAELATNNGPRVDESYKEWLGDTLPSLAQQLKEFLARPESSGGGIDQVDVIAHSMGGLVSRNYALKGNKIRRLVTLGTPNYGGLFSDSFDWVLNNQAEDLEFGCEFTWKLHREWIENAHSMPDVLAVVGTNDALPGKYNQSDSLVRCSSASLENLGFPVYYVPLGHTLANGMAKVDDLAHESWAPIKDFLTSTNPAVASNRPGHQGGVDDVGDASHAEALPGGAAYIVGQRTSGGLWPIPEPAVTWIGGVIDVPFRVDTHESGIYSIVGRDGDQRRTGSSGYTDWTVGLLAPAGLVTRPIRIRAGETTVLVVNENGDVVRLEPTGDPAPDVTDLDGDLLPDAYELSVIAADPFDDIRSLKDLTANTDVDGDGITEIFEMAFGLRSLVPDSAGAITYRIEGGRLILRHPSVGPDVSVRVLGRSSADLRSWSTAVTGPTTVGAFTEWSTPANNEEAFIRLVTEPK